jgi:hypothetical protein
LLRAAVARSTELGRPRAPVVATRGGHELHPFARGNDAAEVLAIVIEREPLVPLPGAIRELAADQPGRRGHPQILRKAAQEVFERLEILPDRRPQKPGLGRTPIEDPERRRQQRAPIARGANGVELYRDLVARQQIVGVEPLHVLALSFGERAISRHACAGMRLADDLDARRREPTGDGQRAIRRAVVDDDDLRLRPGLVQRGRDRLGDPALGVVGGNQD